VPGITFDDHVFGGNASEVRKDSGAHPGLGLPDSFGQQVPMADFVEPEITEGPDDVQNQYLRMKVAG
jgi:hypothetical protein